MARSGLRSECVKILRGGAFSGRRGRISIYCSAQKEPKSLPPDTISGLTMYPYCFCGRGSTRTRWGCPVERMYLRQSCSAPRPPAGFGGRFAAGKGEKGVKKGKEGKVQGRREGKGKGRKGGAGVVVLEGIAHVSSGTLNPILYHTIIKFNFMKLDCAQRAANLRKGQNVNQK